MSASRSRRAFLSSTGALVVLILAPACRRTDGAQAMPSQALNDRIEVNGDGTVRLHLGRIEMGQGLYAAVIQLAAEELDLDMARIQVAPVDTASAPDEGFTDSSASMRGAGMAVRRAAADARAVLLALAAQRWRVPAASLRVEDGTVRTEDGRNTDYWQLLAGVRTLPSAHGTLKRPNEYRLLGRPAPRPDLPAKVRGAPAFVQDLRLSGMLHARVLRPPSPGAVLRRADLAAAQACPGVQQVLRNGSFLAVVAQREEQAIAALETLRASCVWSEPASLPEPQDLYAYLRREAGLPEPKPESRHLSRERRLTATYEVPYRMHGSIGPSCAVAQFNQGQLTVWTHAQGVFPLRSSLAGLVDLPARAIRCIHLEGSGCYGHNGADDAAADAALIARALPGVPVRVQWSREDEHRWEPYGPAMVMRLEGSVDELGRIAQWRHVVASPTHSSRPGGAQRLLAARHLDPPIAPGFLDSLTTWAGGGSYNAQPYYRVPAMVDNRFVRRAPLRSSALRSLGAYANVFAIESFMDELAALASVDPVAFRLAHLDDPRATSVLRLAAQRFGWRADRSPAVGQGVGFARLNGYGAYVAVCVQAVHNEREQPRITRMVAAVDCGELVNPDSVRNQIEGGLVQAASWTLYEQVGFDQTRITSTDWSSYPILRFGDSPQVEVHLIDQPGQAYLGLGEAAQGPGGAAVANAVAMLRGYRTRTLPLVRSP
ncbi:xanthine dehydrogenase family protein molybdopterin-binding subunit [Corticibacter populi]|uniref:Xanthine dehydrogenase family protein molybdopterin-binding subunit n=1 Tax=Corticibacter populi TaxID=1550736 RepID=A0A3M6QKF8_9BURK|nr:molybdopterin cofactor-binding domain-containing protein [Corticibacter populi]RMX03580.1 xanthine dehydrogenase family protein molybdopterin-binding subunit [Corticibacter populi]RZS30035.1 CO/xanthine dehydrogenase Mo-binding subunit [Corticibacter populi]